jgi:hypothetical protein
MTTGRAGVSDEVTLGGAGAGTVPVSSVAVAGGWADGAVEVQPHAKITRTNPSERIQILRIRIASLRQHNKPFNKRSSLFAFWWRWHREGYRYLVREREFFFECSDYVAQQTHYDQTYSSNKE